MPATALKKAHVMTDGNTILVGLEYGGQTEVHSFRFKNNEVVVKNSTGSKVAFDRCLDFLFDFHGATIKDILHTPACVLYEVGKVIGGYHYHEGWDFGEVIKNYWDVPGFNNGVGEGMRQAARQEKSDGDAQFSSEE